MRTFRKILLVAAAALLAANGFCGVGATEKWVANYVSNYVAQAAQAAVSVTSTNGVTTYASGGYRIVIEDATERGLYIIAQSALSAGGGYTNGTVLARVEGQDLYKAGAREIGFTDAAFYCNYGGHTYTGQTVSNRTWLARTEVVTNMENVAISAGPRVSTNLVLFCAIARTYIQPSVAAAILGEE